MRLSARQIPDEIERCALAHQLGMPRILYNTHEESRLMLFLGPFTLLAGSALIATYYILYDSIFSWWPTWQATLIPLIGILWLGVGLWVICSPFIQPQPRVFICPKGLIYTERDGPDYIERASRRNRIVMRWDEIEQIFRHISIDKRQKRRAQTYTVQRRDGVVFIFTPELQHLERLGAFLEREAARHLLPKAIASYDAEMSIDFASFTLSPSGVLIKRGRKRGKLFPWSKIVEMVVGDTSVRLYYQGRKKTKTHRFASANVANISVLKGLITYIKREQERNQLPQVISYKAGLDVSFGRLRVGKAGISIDNDEEVLSWHDVAGIGVGESEIIVRKKSQQDEWLALPIWEIVDAPALRSLLDGIMRGKL